MLRIIKKGIGKIISLLTQIILYVAYFICITPFALVVRFCTDYLRFWSPPAWEDAVSEKDIKSFMEKQ